jgi:glycopeptide antibiotics resistance protein
MINIIRELTGKLRIFLSGYPGYTKFLKWSGTTTYFCLLLYIFFFARRRRHLTEHSYNLSPIKKTFHDFQNNIGDSNAIYGICVNIFGNIILFVPLAMILVWVFRVSSGVTVILSLCLFSLCIEVTQYIFYIGYADIDDILLNTLGAIIGVFICRLFQTNVPLHSYGQVNSLP